MNNEKSNTFHKSQNNTELWVTLQDIYVPGLNSKGDQYFALARKAMEKKPGHRLTGEFLKVCIEKAIQDKDRNELENQVREAPEWLQKNIKTLLKMSPSELREFADHHPESRELLAELIFNIERMIERPGPTAEEVIEALENFQRWLDSEPD